MNLKPTKWKVIVSLVVGFIFLILAAIDFLFAVHFLKDTFLAGIFIFIIIYLSWSIFQNTDFKSKKVGIYFGILVFVILLLAFIYELLIRMNFPPFVLIQSLIIIIVIPLIVYILYRLFQKDKGVFNIAFITGLIGVGLSLLDWFFSTLFFIYSVPNILPSSFYSFIFDIVSEIWFFAPMYVFEIVRVIVTFISYFIIGLIIGLVFWKIKARKS